MANHNHQALIDAIGVASVADRILSQHQAVSPHESASDSKREPDSRCPLDAGAEAFFLKHYAKLSWRQLLHWLSYPEPDASVPSRPGAAVAARIAETLSKDRGLLAITELVPLARAIRDTPVRDEVVAALQGVMDADRWPRLAVLASGGAVFVRIRDVERDVLEQKRTPPFELLNEGPIPMVLPWLFVESRQDHTVVPILREILREEPLRHYAVWLLREAGLLDRVGTPDEVLGSVTPPTDRHSKAAARARFLSQVAANWPDPAVRKAWFTGRAIDAVRSGAPWMTVWWEIPSDLRDEIAVASLETPVPAPWVWRAITTCLTGHDAWSAAFSLADRDVPVVDEHEFNDGLRVAARIGGRAPIHQECQEAFEATAAESRTAYALRLELPPNADDTFDARYLEFARRLALYQPMVLDRLLALPLTPARARRIATFALEHGHFWTLPGFVTIAKSAGPLDVEITLPAFATPDSVAAFEFLMGQRASLALAGQLAGFIEEGKLHEALALAGAARDVVTPELQERLKHLALAQPVSMLVAVQADKPWLLTEADVVATATSTPDDAWSIPDRPPAYLEPVMSAKAVTTESIALAESLLDQLDALRSSKRGVLELALERLRARGPRSLGATSLAKRLDSRTAWDEAGRELTRELMRQGVEGANLLLNVCLDVAMRSKTEVGPLARAMHTAVGAALVGVADLALVAGDRRRARKALTGLAHLNPRSELRSRVRMLRKLTDDPDVRSLIEVNEDLMRRSGDSEAATVDAVRDALIALHRDDPDAESEP